MRLLLRLARTLDDVADHCAHLLQRARRVGVGRVEVDPAGLVLVDDVALPRSRDSSSSTICATREASSSCAWLVFFSSCCSVGRWRVRWMW